MKRTLITPKVTDFPSEFHSLISSCDIYDSSCSREARVWFIDKDGGYYLKNSQKGSLCREAQLTSYFGNKGLGANVLEYISNDKDWLLTSRVAGEDGTYKTYLDDPKRLCDTIANRLRILHEIDPSDCRSTEQRNTFWERSAITEQELFTLHMHTRETFLKHRKKLLR